MLRFLDDLAHLISSLSFSFFFFFPCSFIIIVPFFLYSEFPFSSSTHKRLFNFLLLQDKEKEVEEDDDDVDENDETVLDLIRVRVVTRSCGNTLVGSFRWLLLITSSCINWQHPITFSCNNHIYVLWQFDPFNIYKNQRIII